MQPAANIVAGGPAAPDHLVMATTAAQIAGPAGTARLLPMDVTLFEPVRLAHPIDTGVERSHRPLGIADETVACGQLAIGGHPEIPRAGAAWIRPVGAPMDLAQGVEHVGEGIALAGHRSPFELPAASDHFAVHRREVVALQLALPSGSAEHRRKSDT